MPLLEKPGLRGPEKDDDVAIVATDATSGEDDRDDEGDRSKKVEVDEARSLEGTRDIELVDGSWGIWLEGRPLLSKSDFRRDTGDAVAFFFSFLTGEV